MINPYDIIRSKKRQYLDSSFHVMAFLQVIKAYLLNSRWTMPDCDLYIAPVLGIHPPTKPLWHTHSCGPTAHISVVITMYHIAAAGISVLIISVTRWIQGTATGSSTRMRQWDSWEKLCDSWMETIQYYQPVGFFFHTSHKLAIIRISCLIFGQF